MNNTDLQTLVDRCLAGDISPEEHAILQQHLKGDPSARAAFREMVDLDASLRTWASEDAAAGRSVDVHAKKVSGRLVFSRAVRVSMAVAASFVILLSAWLVWHNRSPRGVHPDGGTQTAGSTAVPLGTVTQQDPCVWRGERTITSGGRVSASIMELVSGVAEVKLDSGTDVVLQGPCTLELLSANEARLSDGRAVIHVTELSDGFVLRTPDAIIIDEGTEYAVAIDGEATEVHVFDGSVIWEPTGTGKDQTERIPSGQARRFRRSRRGPGARIPLEMREFVRRVEDRVKAYAGDGLLAYDGFENLAGRIQGGRAGFGWSEGWKSVGRRRHHRVGEIVDAPDDTVFGVRRAGRRLLRLIEGEAIRRDLAQPLPLDPDNTYFLSFMVRRHTGDATSERSLIVSLYSTDRHRGRRARNELAFGISSEGYPLLKVSGKPHVSAPAIDDDSTHLFVGKVTILGDGSTEMYLRVYRPGDVAPMHEPRAWSVTHKAGASRFAISCVRMSVGANATFDIDELRLGKTWRAVTASPENVDNSTAD